MIRAIVKNGTIQPLEPLPAEWSENRELLIQEAGVQKTAGGAGRPGPYGSRRNSLFVSVVVFGIAGAVAVAAALFFSELFPYTIKNEPLAASTTWKVTPGQGELKSIAEALARAKPGDRIVVAGNEIAEEVTLTDARNITIEAEPGRAVAWRFSGGARRRGEVARRALLTVAGGENVHIKGFNMEGRRAVNHVIYATGNCPGLTLEHLKLSGGRTSGVTMANCAGTKSEPVFLIELDVDTSTMYGVYFVVDNEVQNPPKNENFVIRNCIFKGPESKACRTEPDALNAQSVKYTSNFIQTSPNEPLQQMPPAY